jgi:hypothetical protein
MRIDFWRRTNAGEGEHEDGEETVEKRRERFGRRNGGEN